MFGGTDSVSLGAGSTTSLTDRTRGEINAVSVKGTNNKFHPCIKVLSGNSKSDYSQNSQVSRNPRGRNPRGLYWPRACITSSDSDSCIGLATLLFWIRTRATLTWRVVCSKVSSRLDPKPVRYAGAYSSHAKRPEARRSSPNVSHVYLQSACNLKIRIT